MKYVFLMSDSYLFEIGMRQNKDVKYSRTITITSIVDLSFPVVYMK